MMESLRVAMVSVLLPPTESAIGSHAFALAKHLAEKGHQLTLVHHGQRNKTVNDGEFDRFEIRSVPLYPIHPFATARFNSGWISKHLHRQDIVHYHSPLVYPYDTTGLTVTTCHVRVKHIVEAERPRSARAIVERSFLRVLLQQEKSLLRGSISAIALNQQIENSIRADVSGLPTYVIPNAIDTEAFAANAPDHEPNRILFTGRLIERKNVDTLLRAFGRLRMTIPDASLTIVGKGQQELRLRGLASALGLKDTVEFLGYVDDRDLAIQLRRASVFVLPSFEEGISTSLLEAMATGLVCVASDIPANRAVITHGKNGLLFSPQNPDRLAALLQEVMLNQRLHRHLSSMAMTHVKEVFDWSVVARKVEGVYTSSMSKETTSI